MTFGQKVRMRRSALKLSQAELGKRIGVRRDAIIYYEKDEGRPRQEETRRRLANVLQIPYNDLFRDDNAIDQRKIGLDWELLRETLSDEALPRKDRMQQVRLWKTMLRYLEEDSVNLALDDYNQLRKTLELINKMDRIPRDTPRIVTGG